MRRWLAILAVALACAAPPARADGIGDAWRRIAEIVRQPKHERGVALIIRHPRQPLGDVLARPGEAGDEIRIADFGPRAWVVFLDEPQRCIRIAAGDFLPDRLLGGGWKAGNGEDRRGAGGNQASTPHG